MNFNWLPLFRSQTKEDVEKNNPAYLTFDNVGKDIGTIIDQKFSVINQPTDGFVGDPYLSTFNNLVYMPIITDKLERISRYRMMARYPECDFCLDEISDDLGHTDENGDIIKLKIKGTEEEYNKDKQTVLQQEFKAFMELFKLNEDLNILAKKFLVEGEIAFENIINPNRPELGIIGVKYLPTEFYELLIDPNNGKTVGIYFNKTSLKQSLKNILSSTYNSAINSFQGVAGAQYSQYFSSGDRVPLLWPQITYITTNNTDPKGLIVFPVIDKAKQPYHQLSMLHDAAVILRVTRAPERLLFNISTGNMSDKIARDYVRRFVDDFKSKKVLNNEGEIDKIYNPQTMLESYFFWKSNANDGTSVETVSNTADYSQMEDVKYFLKRLFKQFKVPFSRFDTPQNTMERNETISYEEYSFAKMIIRIQKRFSAGFKKSFITHLKLRGLWKQYNMSEHDIDVEMTKPVLFELYQTQKLASIKMETYAEAADRDEFSKRILMKKILGMTEQEIEDNYRELLREKMYEELIAWYSDQLKNNGPKEVDSPILWKTKAEEPTEPEAGEGEPEQPSGEEPGPEVP